MSAPPRRFTRDTLGLAAGTYAARAVVLVRALVSARVLGAAGFGGWNALSLVLDWGTYAGLGAQQGLDLELPAAAARGDRDGERRRLAAAWAVSLAGGLAFAAVAVAVWLVPAAAAVRAALGTTPLALALAAVLLQLLYQHLAGALRARHRFTAVSAAGALQAVLGAGLGIALVGRLGVTGLLAGWLAGTAAAVGALRLAAPDVPLVPRGLAEGSRLARLGLPVFAFFAASVALRSVDRVALAGRGDLGSLGHYAFGLLAAGLVLYVPEAAGAVLAPRVAAAAHGARDLALTRAETARAQRALALALPVAVALGMFAAGPLTAALLPGFRDAVGVLRVLALGALALAAGTVPGYYLLASGHAPRLARFGVATAALAALLVWGVVAGGGDTLGVAWAAALGYAAFSAGLVAMAARELGAAGGARAFALASFAPAAWGGGLALALCALGGDGWTASLARLGAWLVLYLPMAWWFGRDAGLPAWLHPRSRTAFPHRA